MVAGELVDDHAVKRVSWDALARHLDEGALIEVLMVVGSYVGLAGFLNAVEVEREAGVPGLPSRLTSPVTSRSSRCWHAARPIS
jgi:hypothetical protein